MTRILLILAIWIGAFVSSLFAQSKIEKNYYIGDYNKVIELVDGKLDEGSADALDLGFAARSSAQLFNFRLALHYWEKALSLDSTNIEAIEGIADGYNNLGNYREAIDYYRLILPGDTVDVVFWGKLAGVLTNLEMDKQAADIYSKLLSVEPENLFFMRKLASALYSMKKYTEAKEQLLKYRELNPNDLTLGLALATCYQRMEKDKEAVEVLEEILSVDSCHLTALNKMAYIQYNNLKDYEKAVVLYRKVNFLEGNSDPVHLTNQGICEYFTGNHAFSAHLLDSLAYINTSDPFVWFYAGMSYRKLGEIDRALEYLQTAAKFSLPVFAADIHHHLGRVLSLKRLFPEALKAYEKTREIDPNNSLVLYDMALAHEEMSRNSTLALAYYQQFTRENPNTSSAEYDYAVSRIKKLKEELFFEGK